MQLLLQPNAALDTTTCDCADDDYHIMISTLMLKVRERKDPDPFGSGSATAAAGDRDGGKSAGAASGEVEEDVNSTFLAVIPPAPSCLAESQATVVIEISKPPQSTSARKRQRGTHTRTHAHKILHCQNSAAQLLCHSNICIGDGSILSAICKMHTSSIFSKSNNR
jgi:hypothetical protein